jgi:hypothetical protein
VTYNLSGETEDIASLGGQTLDTNHKTHGATVSQFSGYTIIFALLLWHLQLRPYNKP